MSNHTERVVMPANANEYYGSSFLVGICLALLFAGLAVIDSPRMVGYVGAMYLYLIAAAAGGVGWLRARLALRSRAFQSPSHSAPAIGT